MTTRRRSEGPTALAAVGLEVKRIETRHWAAPASVLGQRIAIHATKTKEWLDICLDDPFSSYISDAGAEALPLGALICTVTVERCARITTETAAALARNQPHEFAFGDYTAGRFAWVLRDVARLPEPVPYHGSQGIFNVPDELLGHVPAQAAMNFS